MRLCDILTVDRIVIDGDGSFVRGKSDALRVLSELLAPALHVEKPDSKSTSSNASGSRAPESATVSRFRTPHSKRRTNKPAHSFCAHAASRSTPSTVLP